MPEAGRFEDLIKVLRPHAYPLILEAMEPDGQIIWRYIISSQRMAERFPPPLQAMYGAPGKLQLTTAEGEIHEL